MRGFHLTLLLIWDRFDDKNRKYLEVCTPIFDYIISGLFVILCKRFLLLFKDCSNWTSTTKSMNWKVFIKGIPIRFIRAKSKLILAYSELKKKSHCVLLILFSVKWNIRMKEIPSKQQANWSSKQIQQWKINPFLNFIILFLLKTSHLGIWKKIIQPLKK